MYGAILGDMIGAPYEFDRGGKTKDFPLFSRRTRFTDDSVMTIAVAEALLDSAGKSDEEVKAALISSMQNWGHKYPYAGYGGMFSRWLKEKNPQPYGSFGNGSAMRVSATGWLYDTIEDTRKYARLTAEVTHNHPEGIKGAEATASAIFMARTGNTKDEIKEYTIREFGYDLSRTCDEIRPTYHHVENCQKTVPEAITAFLEGNDFEDVIRTAVSLGGDCDTLTCIAGGIAEAFYGVSETDKLECCNRIQPDMLEVMDRFDVATGRKTYGYLDGSVLKEAMKAQIKCPFCGSKYTARIIYEVSALSEELQKRLDEGKIALGGCCIRSVLVNGEPMQTDPARVCNDCKVKFGTPPLIIAKDMSSAEDYRDIVTSIRFSVGGFFDGNTEITITKNDNGASVKVNKLPYGEPFPKDRQITLGKWNKILNKLYSQMYLHEWKNSFVNPCALDGTSWEMKIKLTGNRERNYYGSNDYPPYWPELTKIFQEYSKL